MLVLKGSSEKIVDGSLAEKLPSSVDNRIELIHPTALASAKSVAEASYRPSIRL
jgi:hypothetical protein